MVINGTQRGTTYFENSVVSNVVAQRKQLCKDMRTEALRGPFAVGPAVTGEIHYGQETILGSF